MAKKFKAFSRKKTNLKKEVARQHKKNKNKSEKRQQKQTRYKGQGKG